MYFRNCPEKNIMKNVSLNSLLKESIQKIKKLLVSIESCMRY
jgi:hypothetical protein